VYIETSVISYLAARRSRNIVIAARQRLTRQWWRSRSSYRLFVSQIVLDEAAVGDPTARAGRLRALRGVPALAVTDEATQLAGKLVRRGGLPKKATVDAFHIGLAAAHQIEYLLTWNCKHIANATMRGTRGTIDAICRSAGLTPPIICTPEELPSGSST
jgi:predicted nucleic acid-binding protein